MSRFRDLAAPYRRPDAGPPIPEPEVNHDAGEAPAMAAHYAAPASEDGDHADRDFAPQGLGGPDLLAEGLACGFLAHRHGGKTHD